MDDCRGQDNPDPDDRDHADYDHGNQDHGDQGDGDLWLMAGVSTRGASRVLQHSQAGAEAGV